MVHILNMFYQNFDNFLILSFLLFGIKHLHKKNLTFDKKNIQVK